MWTNAVTCTAPPKKPYASWPICAKQFGSWELALAAYNCGAGNVSKAIRNGGSKDFWKIRRIPPAQTPGIRTALYCGGLPR
ncbi:MAG: transglycosylase SLT domain-containing protein [Saprospirales bacterium]|nr:transglycosylase SLT domain-containing protein [Saprospirales bacterium]